MWKKISASGILLLLLFFGIFILPKDEECYVKEVISPLEIILENGEKFEIKEFETFDSNFTERNKTLAKNFKITEDEAFILGNLANYWAKNILEGREVLPIQDDLIYYKYSYVKKFVNSAFCLKDGKIVNQTSFDKLLKNIRRSNYGILYEENFYPINSGKKGLLIKKSQYYRVFGKKQLKKKINKKKELSFESTFKSGNIKIIVSDFTTKLKPDRNCSSDICKEILSNINNSNSSIDIAIYGYSSTPKIEQAIKSAQKRGVKIRLIYDVDTKNQNIYPDTLNFAALIPDNKNDGDLKETAFTMHNKFYIFDNKVVITGSANLSHTDMSGYNSNNIIVINSAEIAKIYKSEFEQMYKGKFHTQKISIPNNYGIYFSPQDKTITNCIIPLIQKTKNYIYIPIFVITENKIVAELINAKNRGVEVKIIADALNASNKYSKIRELRTSGIPVKIENYAGKMHSKTIIADDRYIIIGSMNFSKSGENKNDENTIILENPQAAKFLKQIFLYQWSKIPDKWLKFYPSAEGIDSIGSCFDGIDNDYDGLIDMQDDRCKAFSQTARQNHQ